MSEDQLMKAVIEMAEWAGWRTFHCRDCRKNPGETSAGFPDLVLVRDGHLCFVELKVQRNTLEPEQEAWRTALCLADMEVYIWREQDWLDGTIEGFLQ